METQTPEAEALLAALDALEKSALQEVAQSESPEQLEEIRVRYLGKKGLLTATLRRMGSLSSHDRPVVGQRANQVKERLSSALEERDTLFQQERMQQRLAREQIDVTLPGRCPPLGTYHPLTLVLQRILEIFVGLGYEMVEGPELETDYYNFEALNLPKGHPAREEQDTFYIDNEYLLRTQTSPMQIRTLQARRPAVPVKIVSPGKVYRRDQDDATHSHQFMQLEVLCVDRGITMAHLKGTLLHFARAMFGPQQEVRLRPSFFPFTEPSAEVDLRCLYCGGKGCRICKETGWIEVLGSGMVHPHVLEMAGYDPEQVSGFAVGVGIERIAMLYFGLDEIRHFYLNDLRFLEQFTRI